MVFEPLPRVLTDSKIDSLSTLAKAITTLHSTSRVPHVIVTSVSDITDNTTLSVVGSSVRSDGTPRLFRVSIPKIDCFFSGTGDMFAALTVVRLREAAAEAGLLKNKSWMSGDEVEAEELPLARAVEKVLASMGAILSKTKERVDKEMEEMESREFGVVDRDTRGGIDQQGVEEKSMGEEDEKRRHLVKTKASEIRLVRNVKDLREPVIKWKAERLDV